MNKLILIPLVALCFVLVDLYAFQAVKTAFQHASAAAQRWVFWIYWGVTILTILAFFTYHFGNAYAIGKHFSTAILLGIFTNYISKTFLLLFVIADDLKRFATWGYQQVAGWFGSPEPANPSENAITRSEFLAKAGLITASVPVLAISWGIVSGAHDYRIRRRSIALPNLPRSLDGLRIGQISDIHSGSFWNKTAVKGGVEMLMQENADLVFFTGDLVNNRAHEMEDFMNVFDKVEAPLGVYSILGNHDYGDYVSWSSQQAKVQNMQQLQKIHRSLGWDLLINEHRILHIEGEEIAVLGIENWGAKARFPKYGKMKMAHEGTQEIPVKLLLSHDPSHWRAEVLPMYPDIDVTFSGHTHGMQFGVEIAGVKWSPVQYMYDEWADLYQANNQFLYVNRGFGYLGYPGRIGIPPEITIIELKSA